MFFVFCFSLLPGFSCDQCGKTITQKVNLDRHKSIKHGNPPPQFQCDQCTASFNRKDSLKRHRQGHVIQGRCEPSCRAVTLDPLITNAVVPEPFSASRLVSFDNSLTAYRSHGQSLLMTEASPGQSSSSSSSSNTPRVETSVHFRTHEQRPLTSGIASSHSSISQGTSQQQPSTSNAPSSSSTVQQGKAYKCPDCNYTCQDWCIYVRHRGRCHQFGYGAEDHHILPVLNEEGVVDQALQDLYRQHAHEIYIEHYQGVVHAEYNFPTTNGTITYQQIRNHLEQILRSEGQAFKINMAFGLILRDIVSSEFTFFHPIESDGVMERPILITNQRDIDKFMEMLKNLNILEHLTKRRPNTRKVFHSVTNVMFYINRTEYVLGTAEDLPDYVKNKRSIISLLRDLSTGKDLYEDNKCLFRCLALQFGASQNNLEKKSEALLHQWSVHKNLKTEKFKGIDLNDIPQVEDLFKVSINIHTLLDADTAVSVYISSCRYPSTMYCHLWGHHLSFISNFNAFAKRFHCHLCDKLFKTLSEVRRHEKTCNQGTKFIYPGGYHQVPLTVFEELESYGINVPMQERLYPFFCCFDFEALLVKNECQRGKATTVLQSHQPISVAIASNVCHPDCGHTEKEPACHLCQPLREPVCFVESNVSSLLDQLFAKAEQIQEAAETCTRKKLQVAFAKLDQKISLLEVQKDVLKEEGVEAEAEEGEEEEEGENEEESGDNLEAATSMESNDLIKKKDPFLCEMEKNQMQENSWGIPDHEDESSENEDIQVEDFQEDEADDYTDFQLKETEKQLKIFKNLKSRLEEYARVLPLLGFNNAR